MTECTGRRPYVLAGPASVAQASGLPRSPLALLAAMLATILLASVASLSWAAAPPVREPFPKRKAGLWEIKSVSLQAAGLPPTQLCVGEDTDAPANHLDRSVGERGACSLGAFQRAGLAWLAESVCKEGRSTATSRAIASGDFLAEYRIDTVVTYNPPLGGVRREDKEAVIAYWVSPCTSSQKPGDTVIPGMGTLNMIDGTFRAEPPPPRPDATAAQARKQQPRKQEPRKKQQQAVGNAGQQAQVQR